MADISKTVEIIFGGKNEVSKTVDEIGKSFGNLDGLVSKVTDPLAKIGKSVLETDAALAAMAIGGLAVAIKASGDFEESFDKVALRITGTSEQIGKFKGDVLTYAADSTRSLTDINAALAESIQRGTSYKDALAELSTAEHLAVATHSDLKSATILLSTTMNAYGASVSEAAHYGDVFTQGIRLGAGEIPALAGEMGKISGIAHAMGIPIETITAALAALGSYGVDSGTALAGLTRMLAGMLDPEKKAKDEANKLGISFSATAVQTKGLEGVLKDAYTATNGNAEAMKLLFGSVRGLNVAFDLAADSQGHFRDDLALTRNATGVMQKSYEEFVNDFGNVNQRLENSFKVTLVSIGDKLMPEYGKVAGALGDLMKGIKVGIDSGAFDPLFQYLDQVGGSLAEWIKGVAAAFPEALKGLDFTQLIAAFNDLGRAINAYFGGLDLTKANDLGSAMQTLIDMITGIIRITTGMADAFRPFATVIGEFFKSLAAGGPETQETMGKILALSMAIQSAGLGLVAAILAIDEFRISMTGLFNTVAGGSQVMWNGFQILLTGIKGMVIIVGGLFVELLDKLTFGLMPGLDSMKSKLTEWGSTLGPAFEKDGTEAAQGLSRLATGLYQIGIESGTSKDKAAELRKGLLDLPAVTAPVIKVTGAEDSARSAADVKKNLSELPDLRKIGIQVLADGTAVEKANKLITEYFPDGRVLITNVGTAADETGLIKTQKKIDDAIPKEKQVEILAKLDETKIKTQSEEIQKAIEWKAKLDIANVEANAKIVEATFKSIDNTITSTGTTLTSMMGNYAELSGSGKGGTSFIEQQISDENRRRDEALVMQKSLTEAEVANIKARTEAIGRGESIIKIDGTGLAPHLEAFMFAVLAAIQVRVNQDYGDFLVGVK